MSSAIISVERRRGFVAKLLAPMPEGVEQPSDKRFLRELKADARDVWHRGMLHVSSAAAWHEHLTAERLITLRAGGSTLQASAAAQVAWNGYVQEIDRQMRVAAPDKAALDWKRRKLKVGGFKDVIERRQALIAADEARLARLSEVKL